MKSESVKFQLSFTNVCKSALTFGLFLSRREWKLARSLHEDDGARRRDPAADRRLSGHTSGPGCQWRVWNDPGRQILEILGEGSVRSVPGLSWARAVRATLGQRRVLRDLSEWQPRHRQRCGALQSSPTRQEGSSPEGKLHRVLKLMSYNVIILIYFISSPVSFLQSRRSCYYFI